MNGAIGPRSQPGSDGLHAGQLIQTPPSTMMTNSTPAIRHGVRPGDGLGFALDSALGSGLASAAAESVFAAVAAG